MDSMHHNQGHQSHHDPPNLDGSGVYNFNHAQNDTFNSFFNPDSNPSYTTPWDPDVLVDPQIQSSGFGQANDAWHQNPLNATTTLPTSNYAVQPREYNHPYARNPPAFRYASFDNHPSHSFTTPSFDPSLPYDAEPFSSNSGYDIPIPIPRGSGYGASSVQGQTISPQALQAYPNALGQFSSQADSQDSQFPNEPLSLRSAAANRTFSRPAYNDHPNSLLAENDGLIRNSLSDRNPTALNGVTDSQKFTGFIFLSGNTSEADGIPVILPKVNQRKSKNAMSQNVSKYLGNLPPGSELKPLFKKLKTSISRDAPIGTPGSMMSPLDSPSVDLGSSSASGGEPDSDQSESGSGHDKAIPESIPLPLTKPNDPMEAIKYEVIKSVWAPSKGNVGATAIRTALGEFWNIVKKGRDQWRAEVAIMQQAELKKDQPKVDQSISRAIEKRRVLENIFHVTLVHGHRDIVGSFGLNEPLLLVFYQLLADRFKEGDYNGLAVSDLLELITKCTTIDQPLLEKVKLDKVLLKLLKRGDDKIRALSQKVLDHVTSITKQKEPDTKPAQAPINSTSKAIGSTVAPASGPRTSEAAPTLKKQREGSFSSAQPPKRAIAAPLSKPTSGQPTRPLKAVTKGAQVTKAETKSLPATSNPAPKVKVNHVTAKPSTFFSSLQSASKKPGTSNAALKAAQKPDGKNENSTESKPTITPVVPPAAPKPAFSFAETMANLTKPKEVASTTKLEENRPPETEEEKSKRLRKEERRKLRVSFKPEGSLVEIRTFVHDPEEEMGHDDSMIRDVGDIGSEGRMLKMHKELEAMDEDEDSTAGEQTLAVWCAPSLVDFSIIAADELERTYVRRGGKLETKSHERAVQEQRELTTLMTFYSTLSDIPSTPREPFDPFSGSVTEERDFGSPQDETKIREAQFYATQNPQLHSYQPPLPVTMQQTPDISALLQILNGQQQIQQPHQFQQYQQPQQPQVAPAPASGLEAIFAQFSNSNASAAQTHMPQQSTSAMDPSLQAALAAINQQSQPQMGYVPPPAGQTTDLQAILSQFSQQPTTQLQGYSYQTAFQTDNDRKRPYEYDRNANNQYSDGKRVRGDSGKKFFGVPRVVCRFWQEGKCRKGDECTFLHE